MNDQNIRYDFYTLPEPPFPIYFLDESGEIEPKQIFTVTRKRINVEGKCVEVFVMELRSFFHHDVRKIFPVSGFNVN